MIQYLDLGVRDCLAPPTTPVVIDFLVLFDLCWCAKRSGWRKNTPTNLLACRPTASASLSAVLSFGKPTIRTNPQPSVNWP